MRVDSNLQKMAVTAGRLADDEGFKLILSELKNRTIRKWAEARRLDVREETWHELQAIAKLENLICDIPQVLTLEKTKEATRKPKDVR